MATWDVVATLKAPAEQVLAFAAHHLSLGAGHLWLYFDDPDAAVPAALTAHPKVTVTLCDDPLWRARGRRPERHQNRQARNAQDAYARTKSQWLTHIDVDEFIHTDREISGALNSVHPDALVIQMEPFEAMHDPSLPDDIFTARAFRGPLKKGFANFRDMALGSYAALIPDGMLSHSVGKCFFRSGIEGLTPRLHGAMLAGSRVPSFGRLADTCLLHFHAQDREGWLAALPYRLTRGAYQYKPDMQAFLLSASPQLIDHFYHRTQVLAPDAEAKLAAIGRIHHAALGLRQKANALLEHP